MFDDATIKAIKSCIVGTVTKEIVTEYVYDEDAGEMKITKQKVSEKNVPPNVDIIKLIYSMKTSEQSRFESLTDEELEREKQRLLSILKEEESGSRKNTRKTEM